MRMKRSVAQYLRMRETEGWIERSCLILCAALIVITLAGCASGPRSASDCGYQFRAGTGLLGLLGATGAFDRPAGPDCALSGSAESEGAPPTPKGPEVQTVPAPDLGQTRQFGQPVIDPEDCIGAVVAGVCHGVPKPGAPTATCYGQMIGGVCTGPMF